MSNRLAKWLDENGDLMSITNRILSFGPFLVAGIVLTIAVRSNEILWWLGFCVLTIACLLYYVAFFKALVRQRERFYQREVKPLLSSEYRDG